MFLKPALTANIDIFTPGVTADNSTLRIVIGLYPISDNCVREYTLWLSGRALDYSPDGPGLIPTKVMGYFQPNLLCFVLCCDVHVVRWGLSLELV